MSSKNRTYTREFKLEVLELLKSSGKAQVQLEEELGIGHGNISRWKREMAEEGEQAFPGKGHLTAEEEQLRKLEREITILRQERDILKKVVEIFSRSRE